MVKRCSATTCFNSQLTHKISYFGYPRNQSFAKEWALLSGRPDLLEKKHNIVKFYLCSDHFKPEDFINPDEPDKTLLMLKKTRQHIPLPSIFEDNLAENVNSVKKNHQKFFLKKIPSVEPSQKIRNFVQLEEHLDLHLEQEHIPDQQEDEYIERNFSENSEQNVETLDIDCYCRLCARECEELVPIFDEHGETTDETECFKIMPIGVIMKNDGLPQYTCVQCLSKLQSCASTIDGFVNNQNFFVYE